MLALPPAIICQASQPAALSRDELYQRAVKERLAGNFAGALKDARTLLASDPGDVDARLELGFALRALGRSKEAEDAFREVLRRAPSYKDARVALADLLLDRGDIAGAKAELGPELMQAPGDAETQALVDKLNTAKPAPLWRVDEVGLYSVLNKGLQPWWENDLSVSRQVVPDTSVAFLWQSLNRFGIGENYVQGSVDHGWPGMEATLAVGGSLHPLFRPRLWVQGDLMAGPWKSTPWRYNADVSFAQYVVGDVETVTVGADRFFFGDRGKLGARFIGVEDENHQFLPGFLVGGSWRFTHRVQLSASYSDSGEEDTGRTMRAQDANVSADYTLTERLTFHAGVTDEYLQHAYNRVEFALGLTAKF
jgi:YaiO family outer membrane protein